MRVRGVTLKSKNQKEFTKRDTTHVNIFRRMQAANRRRRKLEAGQREVVVVAREELHGIDEKCLEALRCASAST